MATVLEYAKRDVNPLAIEPYDREWGVAVSGLSDEKSPFPRINRLHAWVRNKRHSVDPKRGHIVTEAFLDVALADNRRFIGQALRLFNGHYCHGIGTVEAAVVLRSRLSQRRK